MKRVPIQWRLTILIAALIMISCVLLNLTISRSAFTGIDSLENYMVQVDENNGSEPITFSINLSELMPDISAQIEETKNRLQIQGMIATVLIILAGSFCTYFLTWKALEPLRRLSERIKEIQAQNLSVPMEVPETRDEIARLTSSFNEMLARLDKTFALQRQFSANTAHELRTPLAVIQTKLDIFRKKGTASTEEYEGMLDTVQEQTGRLSHMVDVLLEMSRLQTTQRTDRISLAELVEEVLCDLDQVAEDRQVELVQQDGDSVITGSYLLLYRAVYNLVENGIKYNRSPGKVTVGIQQKEDKLVLTVEDTGPGILPEEQEKIFEPFYRVDKAGSRAAGGTGLGLALVKEIARQHEGDVKVLKSSEQGTVFGMELDNPGAFRYNTEIVNILE